MSQDVSIRSHTLAIATIVGFLLLIFAGVLAVLPTSELRDSIGPPNKWTEALASERFLSSNETASIDLAALTELIELTDTTTTTITRTTNPEDLRKAQDEFRDWLLSVLRRFVGGELGLWGVAWALNLVLALAYGSLYKFYVVDKLRMQKLPAQGQLGTSEFNYGPCDCCAHRDMCCMVIFCPCVRAAHTLEATGICGYWFSLLFYTLSCLIPGGYACLGTYARIKLKRHLGLQIGCLADFIMTLACFLCTVSQQALHVDYLMGRKVLCCLRLTWIDDDVQWLYETQDEESGTESARE